MIIPLALVKAFDKTQHPFIIIVLEKLEMQDITQHKLGNYSKNIINITLY